MISGREGVTKRDGGGGTREILLLRKGCGAEKRFSHAEGGWGTQYVLG